METMQAPNDLAGTNLTVLGERWIRVAAVVMTLIVAGASAVLSWNGLRMLGIQAGFGGMAFLLPVSIDGMLFLGSVSVVFSSLKGISTRYGWLMNTVGIALSIFGNLLSVPNHEVIATIAHIIPPIMLALSVESLVRIVKLRISEDMEHQAVLEQEARREAKRREREAQSASLKEARAKNDSKALLSQTKRGGKKVSSTDPEVFLYRSVLVELPESVSKIGKVEAILRRYPAARSSHIAMAMELEPRGLGTTIQRAKAKLLKETEQEPTRSFVSASDKPEDAFQEIVKGLS